MQHNLKKTKLQGKKGRGKGERKRGKVCLGRVSERHVLFGVDVPCLDLNEASARAFHCANSLHYLV